MITNHNNKTHHTSKNQKLNSPFSLRRIWDNNNAERAASGNTSKHDRKLQQLPTTYFQQPVFPFVSPLSEPEPATRKNTNIQEKPAIKTNGA